MYASCRHSPFAIAISLIRYLPPANALALVLEDRHEIGQPRDLENLLVVRAESVDEQAALGLARAGQQADDQCDARAVHVADIAKVENNARRVLSFGFGIGRDELRLGCGVDLAVQVNNGRGRLGVGLTPHAGFKRLGWHLDLLVGA